MPNPAKIPKKNTKIDVELPPIPDKLYFGIGEVAKLCDIKTHVLRYWEEEFESLAPIKRRGNRRFYQRKEVVLIRRIRTLLYIQGFTIEGAKTQLLSNTEKSADSSVAFLKKIVENLEIVLHTLQK
jgi:DNA-binding transcriptional MerR regulator